MTTEPPATPEPMPSDQPASTPPAAPAPAPSSMSSFSGETLVMFGGALVLGSYLVFALIADEFHQFTPQLIAAAFAVIVPLINRDAVGKVASYPTVMKVIGYVIAVAGVFEILYDVRFGILDDVWDIMGALVAYAGYVLAFIGARMIKT
jgi:hypothetical protein